MLTRDELNQLYQYGVSLTADEQLAWDLVHDSVEKLISRPFVLNKVAYTKRAIRNGFYDHLKSKNHSRTTPLHHHELTVEDNIEDLLDSKEAVSKIMKSIKPKERELLYLWAVEEYTTKEISELMKMPKGTVTSKLKRLRDRLQQRFGATNG